MFSPVSIRLESFFTTLLRFLPDILILPGLPGFLPLFTVYLQNLTVHSQTVRFVAGGCVHGFFAFSFFFFFYLSLSLSL